MVSSIIDVPSLLDRIRKRYDVDKPNSPMIKDISLLSSALEESHMTNTGMVMGNDSSVKKAAFVAGRDSVRVGWTKTEDDFPEECRACFFLPLAGPAYEGYREGDKWYSIPRSHPDPRINAWPEAKPAYWLYKPGVVL